jgi:hypothetical protein
MLSKRSCNQLRDVRSCHSRDAPWQFHKGRLRDLKRTKIERALTSQKCPQADMRLMSESLEGLDRFTSIYSNSCSTVFSTFGRALERGSIRSKCPAVAISRLCAASLRFFLCSV